MNRAEKPETLTERKTLRATYAWHRGRTGRFGHDAQVALSLARAEVRIVELIDAGLARFTWESDDPERLLDVDAGSEAETKKWRAQISADLERGYLSCMSLLLEIREPKCKACGHDPGWEVIASLGGIGLAGDTERDARRMFEAEMAYENIDTIEDQQAGEVEAQGVHTTHAERG